MTKFNGKRKLDDIINIMEQKEMIVDTQDFDCGGDWCYFKGDWHDMPLTIALNVCSGRFMVYNGFTGEKLATESSANLDDQAWYSELLNVFYIAA